jgi:hypothetical protein
MYSKSRLIKDLIHYYFRVNFVILLLFFVMEQPSPGAEAAEDGAAAGEGKPSCLAEQLWFPFFVLVAKPKTTAIAVAVSNGVFIFLWVVLGFISSIITKPGLFCLFLYGIFAFVRMIARSLTYPAHTRMVVRDMERECAKQMASTLVQACQSTNECLEVLGNPQSAMNRKWEFHHVYQELMQVRQESLQGLRNALARMKQDKEDASPSSNEGQFSAEAESILVAVEHLMNSIDQLNSVVRTFYDLEPSLFEATRLSLLSSGASDSARTSDVTMLPLDDVHASVAQAEAVIPLMGGEKVVDNSFFIVRNLRSYWLARQPMQIADGRLAVGGLDLMRADLAVRQHGEQMWITSKDGTRVDGMLLSCSQGRENASGGAGSSDGISVGAGASSSRPTVLICNPNAGLFELHHYQVLHSLDKSIELSSMA